MVARNSFYKVVVFLTSLMFCTVRFKYARVELFMHFKIWSNLDTFGTDEISNQMSHSAKFMFTIFYMLASAQQVPLFVIQCRDQSNYASDSFIEITTPFYQIFFVTMTFIFTI